MSAEENTSHNDNTAKQRRLAQLKPIYKSIYVDSLTKLFPQDKWLTNNLPAFFDLLAGKAPFTPDDKTRKLGLQFLQEAARDIKSCKVLYSKKLFPHAIYHLQQAVEKAIKGYVLLEGYYKATELREIKTHDTLLIMLKAVLERTGIKKLVEGSNDTTIMAKIMDAESTIEDEEKRIEIAKINKAEIKGLLSRIEEDQKKTNSIKQVITTRLTTVGTNTMPTSFFQAVSAMMPIVILAIITFPHESYTRYPDGKMTPTDYDRQLGIVLETPAMAQLLEVGIRNLEKFYEVPA